MLRSPTGKSNSPWAVKKINTKCNVKQKSVYLERLQIEAKRLKDLEHPNIVGRFNYCGIISGKYSMYLSK